MLLSPGADPVAEIERFAVMQEHQPPPTRVKLSLGQGQVYVHKICGFCLVTGHDFLLDLNLNRVSSARPPSQAPDECECFSGTSSRLRNRDGDRAGRVGDTAELSPRRGLDPDTPAQSLGGGNCGAREMRTSILPTLANELLHGQIPLVNVTKWHQSKLRYYDSRSLQLVDLAGRDKKPFLDKTSHKMCSFHHLTSSYLNK